MTDEQLNHLIAKVLAGQATPDEEALLDNWYHHNITQNSIVELLSSTEQAELLNIIKTNINHRNGYKKIKRMVYQVAASLALLALGWWGWQRLKPKGLAAAGSPVAMQQYYAPKGQKRKISLPDGTQVWLNADSHLQLSNNFNVNRRDVSLQGEAYFEVSHNAHKPFIVHTSQLDVRVLGTVFNVKAYNTDGLIETTLLRGSVEVRLHSQTSRRILLKPLQKFTLATNLSNATQITPQARLSEVPKPNADTLLNETSWHKNVLSFENETFEQLARDLERWYNIHIVFNNQQVKTYRFTGTLSDADFDTVMKALMLSRPFSYRKEDNSTVIID